MFKRICYGSVKLFTFIFLCLLITLFTFKTYAQTINGDSVVLISLQQAIDLGLRNSYKLKSADLAVEIDNESIKQEKTNRLPDLNIGIDGFLINDPTLYNEPVFQDPEKIDYTPYQVSGNVGFSEVIYGGKRIKNLINQEILQKKITEFSAAITETDIKMLVINEYLRLYNLLKDYEINVKTINQIELRLKTLRSKFLNGQIVKNDVSRSELQKSDFELKLLHAISNVSVTNYFLTLLLGLNQNTIIQVDTAFNYTVDTLFVFEDCLLTAFENRPEFQISQTNKELAENSLRLIKGAYHPTVNGVGLYGLQNPVPGTFPPEGKFLGFFTIGVGINYNLGSFYKLKHQKLSSALAIQREQENVKDLQIALSDEVRTQMAQYEVQRESLNIFLKKIQFAEENYRIIQSRYYNDLALISDIVDAELEYNQARLDLVRGQVQTRINYYRVMKAIGKL